MHFPEVCSPHADAWCCFSFPLLFRVFVRSLPLFCFDRVCVSDGAHSGKAKNTHDNVRGRHFRSLRVSERSRSRPPAHTRPDRRRIRLAVRDGSVAIQGQIRDLLGLFALLPVGGHRITDHGSKARQTQEPAGGTPLNPWHAPLGLHLIKDRERERKRSLPACLPGLIYPPIQLLLVGIVPLEDENRSSD